MLRKLSVILIILIALLCWPKEANAKPLSQTPNNYVRVCYDLSTFCSSVNNNNSELETLDGYIAQVLANEWHSGSTLEAYRAGAIAVRTFGLRSLGCGAWIRAVTELPPFISSNMVSNGSQIYRFGGRNGTKNTVTSAHTQARNDTANVYIYRNDNAYACARHVTHTGNPSKACPNADCTLQADRDLLPEMPEPVHQGNVVQPRSFIGMSQNGSVAWSMGNAGWTYRQMLSHYYSKVKIGSTTDNNNYRWVWLTTGTSTVFSGFEGENYYGPIANTPALMGAGVVYNVPMYLQNTGSSSWNNPSLSYSWYNTANSDVTNNNRIFTFLIGTIAPSAAFGSFPAQVRGYHQPGTYTLKWDMNQSGTWFSQQNNWPTQNITVQVVPSVNQTLWRGNQGWSRSVLIINGSIDWSTASPWSGPFTPSGLALPGTGDLQTLTMFRASNTMTQGYWRGNEGRVRTIPVTNGVINWAAASSWSAAISPSGLPGSGSMQAQSEFVVGNTVWQTFWRAMKAGQEAYQLLMGLFNGIHLALGRYQV